MAERWIADVSFKEGRHSAQTMASKGHSPAPVRLLTSWSQERENFVWTHCKQEIICVLASLNVLLVLILVCHLATTGAHKLCFVLPWLAAIVGSAVLLVKLVVDYAHSQTACFNLSPFLFLLAFLCWFLPIAGPKTGVAAGCSEPEQGVSELIGLLMSIILPWLLGAAPIMAWKASCFLSLATSFLFFSTLVCQIMATKSSSQIMVLLPAFFSLTVSNVLLAYLRSLKASRLLSMIDAWADAFNNIDLLEEQAQAALQEKEKDSKERISKMRQFISYIFHEIRVPFNAVVLGIGHLVASSSSEDHLEILKMMDLSASSMIHILNDVLDIGKIEAGKLHLEKQPFSMQEMLSSLIWAFKDTFDSKGINFSLLMDPCTSEVLSNYNLLGDKHRVRQVLANFLSNAIKFTPSGGNVTLCVVCNGHAMSQTFSKEEESLLAYDANSSALKHSLKVANLTVSVKDTGIGICKEDQALLFEPYTQISASSSQGGGGTGLGLSFAKRIVELAGGKIELLSEIGKGSVFQFTMPFQLAENLKERETKTGSRSGNVQSGVNSEESSSDPFLHKPPRVLIVEDNLVNRRILRKLLESFNVASDDAENGKEALELVRNGGLYDMILIDKEMPIMDGHEATRELRAMGVKSPIVGLTGNALNSDRNQFLAAGVDEFLIKPLSRHQLVNLLEMYGLVMKGSKQHIRPTT